MYVLLGFVGGILGYEGLFDEPTTEYLGFFGEKRGEKLCESKKMITFAAVMVS